MFKQKNCCQDTMSVCVGGGGLRESHRPLYLLGIGFHPCRPGRKVVPPQVKWKSLSRVRLFVTPWTVAHQAPLSMEFSRQEYWSGLPIPSTEDLLNPGIEPWSPALQADSLLSEPPGISLTKPHWEGQSGQDCCHCCLITRHVTMHLCHPKSCWPLTVQLPGGAGPVCPQVMVWRRTAKPILVVSQLGPARLRVIGGCPGTERWKHNVPTWLPLTLPTSAPVRWFFPHKLPDLVHRSPLPGSLPCCVTLEWTLASRTFSAVAAPLLDPKCPVLSGASLQAWWFSLSCFSVSEEGLSLNPSITRALSGSCIWRWLLADRDWWKNTKFSSKGCRQKEPMSEPTLLQAGGLGAEK